MTHSHAMIELEDARVEIERLKASNEFKAEAIRQSAGRCLELMQERNELAAANHQLFEELRRHVDGCGCKLNAHFSSTAANALRDLLKPTVELLNYLHEMLTNHPCDGHKEFCICWYCTALRDVNRERARLRALMGEEI